MAAKPNTIDHWVKHSLASEPPRSKSLIITIFGDSLHPYVPGVWLSELMALLEPFGVNSQLARTSAFRLAAENWLQSRREGRKSFYFLTDSGRQRVEHAYQRIYELPPREWDGNWTLVMLSSMSVPVALRTELRRELEWEGFGLLAPRIFIHPRAQRANLDQLLRRLRLTEEVMVMQARDLDGVVTKHGIRLASECWDSKLVSRRYDGFVSRFQALEALLQPGLQPETAFVVQTLLIHSFRRVVLHDPQLPAVLLPADWPGHVAYDLCRSIYRKTFLQTRAHLASRLEAAASASLRPAAEFNRRLGGLTDSALEPQSRRM